MKRMLILSVFVMFTVFNFSLVAEQPLAQPGQQGSHGVNPGGSIYNYGPQAAAPVDSNAKLLQAVSACLQGRPGSSALGSSIGSLGLGSLY